MTIEDFKKAGVPLIGFGPGIVKTSNRQNSQHNRIYRRIYGLLDRIENNKLRQHYVDAVSNAIQIGFRLLDYSSAYGDGELLQKAIAQSGVNRDELFITTRVSNRAQREGEARKEFMDFLNTMHLDYVDLLQFHWPVTDLYLDTWREMENLKEEGYVKHLGVANCHRHHLEEIFKVCKYKPEIGQFEIHPLFTQKPLIQYYQDNNIVVEAYTPIARYDDRLVRLPLLKRLEKKYNKTFVQIILRWHIQNGVIPLVRSMSKEHQLENFSIFDFELSAEDMAAIDSININSRLRYDPDNCDFSIL